MANDVSNYPNKRTPAYLAAVPKATKANFGLNFTYYVPRQVGVESIGGSPVVYEDRYVLKPITVANLSIPELTEFLSWIEKGQAYLQATSVAPTTTP